KFLLIEVELGAQELALGPGQRRRLVFGMPAEMGIELLESIAETGQVGVPGEGSRNGLRRVVPLFDDRRGGGRDRRLSRAAGGDQGQDTEIMESHDKSASLRFSDASQKRGGSTLLRSVAKPLGRFKGPA